MELVMELVIKRRERGGDLGMQIGMVYDII